jgi:membrane-associated phospholipid phosphatase
VDVVAELFESLLGWDSAASSFAESLRWQPLTVVFLLASAWWVKWPLIAAFGALGDATHRRVVPRATLAAIAAVASVGVAVTILKQFFDRARPPVADPSIHAIGIVPSSASLPSGHAATAFAAAVAVGLVYPQLRRPLLAMAAVVALSRVYLGMHYLSDVLAGAALGALLGLAAAWAVRAVAPEPRAPAPSLGPPGTSFAPRRTAPE